MSGFAEYEAYDAIGLAGLVRKREASAGELLDAAIARVEPATWALARMADEISDANYVNAILAMHRVGRQVARFFLDYDVALTPAMAKPPPVS